MNDGARVDRDGGIVVVTTSRLSWVRCVCVCVPMCVPMCVPHVCVPMCVPMCVPPIARSPWIGFEDPRARAVRRTRRWVARDEVR